MRIWQSSSTAIRKSETSSQSRPARPAASAATRRTVRRYAVYGGTTRCTSSVDSMAVIISSSQGCTVIAPPSCGCPRVGRWGQVSGEEADAARSDEEADDDEHEPIEHSTPEQGHEAGDDEDDCDEPQDKLHAACLPGEWTTETSALRILSAMA